jgi:hypothetical protein
MASSLNTYTFGAALTWVQNEYEYLCHEVESGTTLFGGTGQATRIVANNGDRLELAIVVTGPAPVFVALTGSFAAGDGILLGANGGAITINVRQDLTLPTREWFAQAAGPISSLYILEIIGWKRFPKGSVPGYTP